MKLAAGAWSLVAAPELGGAIRSLSRDGHDILRPSAPDATEPFDLACFPLLPYANRIAHGRFVWQGRQVSIPRNHAGQAHPLHGIGWLAPWRVTAADGASATMRFDHAASDAWPWDLSAVQVLELTGQGLAMTLELTNGSDSAMPASIGFHPYFAKSGVSTLAFDAASVWLASDELLPRALAPADALGDWSRGGSLERADLVDHCYVGWNGNALVSRADGDVLLRGGGTDALHVYVPPGEAFFCAEPVTAMPDAVNHGAAATLAPGETISASMAIRSA